MRVRALVLLAACAATGPLAHAQQALDPAAAETLFVDGRKLLTEGKYAEACPKLAESQRLDPGAGTLYNLSDCYEKLGKTASAWAGFAEVARLSKAAGNSAREEDARTRAAALEPRLPKLTVSVTTRVRGLLVKRDDVEIGAAAWSAPIPVDPGEHTLAATAPGKKPWQLTFLVKDRPDTTTIAVPALEDAAPEAARERVVVRSDGSGQRAVGLTVGGAGLVGVGIGVAFGIVSINKKSAADASPDCTGNRCRTDEGIGLREDAYSAGTISTIAFGVGLGALIAGSVLFFTAAKDSGPRLDAGPGGVRIAGEW